MSLSHHRSTHPAAAGVAVAASELLTLTAPAARAAVFNVLNGERDYQDARRGNSARENVSDNRDLGSLLLLHGVYLTQAHIAFAGPHPAGRLAALDILRKATALGVLAMELHGAPSRAEAAKETTSAAAPEPKPEANTGPGAADPAPGHADKPEPETATTDAAKGSSALPDAPSFTAPAAEAKPAEVASEPEPKPAAAPVAPVRGG